MEKNVKSAAFVRLLNGVIDALLITAIIMGIITIVLFIATA